MQRLMWGKTINSGQTCIAPDYILCHKNHFEKVTAHMKTTLVQMFGDDQKRCAPTPSILLVMLPSTTREISCCVVLDAVLNPYNHITKMVSYE